MARMHKNRFPREFAFDRQIGRKVRLARTESGMRQADLADKLGICLKQISHYETARHRITASRLVTISKILGYPPAWFLEGAA